MSYYIYWLNHVFPLHTAPVIFAEVFYNENEDEASENGDEFALVILSVVKLVITIFVLFFVDKLGRLFFLKTGATIITVSLLSIAISLTVGWEETTVTESGKVEHVHSPLQDALVLIGCSGVVTGFALSYGLVWLIASELSPSHIRGRMLGFFAVLTHGCAALVASTFLSDQEKYGDVYPFWVYFCCSLASLAFIFAAVPETEGVDGCVSDDIESLLDETSFWKKDNPIFLYFGRCKKKSPIHHDEIIRIDLCFDDVVATNRRHTFV